VVVVLPVEPLQPLLPVVATPSTTCRWPRKKSRIIGTVVMTEAVTTISSWDPWRRSPGRRRHRVLDGVGGSLHRRRQ
jgi:hypothetical protein